MTITRGRDTIKGETRFRATPRALATERRHKLKATLAGPNCLTIRHARTICLRKVRVKPTPTGKPRPAPPMPPEYLRPDKGLPYPQGQTKLANPRRGRPRTATWQPKPTDSLQHFNFDGRIGQSMTVIFPSGYLSTYPNWTLQMMQEAGPTPAWTPGPNGVGQTWTTTDPAAIAAYARYVVSKSFRNQAGTPTITYFVGIPASSSLTISIGLE